MEEETYRIFLAIAAVATTLTFLFTFGPDAAVVASAWEAAAAHPVLAVGLAVPVVGGLAWVAVKWLDEH